MKCAWMSQDISVAMALIQLPPLARGAVLMAAPGDKFPASVPARPPWRMHCTAWWYFPDPHLLPRVTLHLRRVTAVSHEPESTWEASWAQVPSPPWKQRGTGGSGSRIYCQSTQYTLGNLKAGRDVSSITKIYQYTDTQYAFAKWQKNCSFHGTSIQTWLRLAFWTLLL